MRKGPEFLNTFNFLKKSEYWNKEKLEKYQLRELQKLVWHAYKNVPYYTDLKCP